MMFKVIDGGQGDHEEWPYPWERDGLCYRYCVRCAIRMELPESQLWSAAPREYCADCDYPEFHLRDPGFTRALDLAAVIEARRSLFTHSDADKASA